MTIPPYVEPDSTSGWEEEQFGQPMSIAQAPVHNFQHRHEHATKYVVKNLIAYATA
jgi:hypothetical protein